MNKEFRRKVSVGHKGQVKTKEMVDKQKKTVESKYWNDKQWRENHLKKMLQGLIKRPTSLEQQMLYLIKKHNLPYKYTGNGKFWIDGKNPDFVNINGEKKLIEVGNTYHHQGKYIENRKSHFAKYGWESYIFITDYLDENEILSKIKEVK